MDPVLSAMAIGASMLGALALVKWRSEPRRRARRQLSAVPGKPLGAIVAGERVRVLGVALRGERVLETPFTGRRCLVFRAAIEEYLQGDGDGGGGEWREIFANEEGLPFELVADGVEARVEGPFFIGLEIDARSEDDEELSPATLERFARLGVYRTGSRPLRFREAALEHGDPIYVLGRASVVVDPTGRRESPRGQPVKRVLRGTDREPTVLADEDQPGVLAPPS